ncbi:unnamed protein product [Ectocarpus sp. 12 AP-2014]
MKTVNNAVGRPLPEAKASKLPRHSKEKPEVRHTFDRKGDWSLMDAARWHDSMYYKGSYFWQLFHDTQVYTRRATSIYCGPPARSFSVEVGCGTGDVILSLASDFKHSLGIDINDGFLAYAQEQTPKELKDKISFCKGSATDLIDIVSAHPSIDNTSAPTVVTCVNNTIGIFPDAIKARTYSQQMKELAGENGIIIVGFWNGNKFGEALQYFYHKHPELCGSLKGAVIDMEDRHLDTAEGYHTHWTTPEEARRVLEESGFNVLDITEIGVGVLCTCSGGASIPSPRGGGGAATVATFLPHPDTLSEDTLIAEEEAHSLNHYGDSFTQYFYRELWGGLHQHLGLYEDPATIALPANKRVVEACENSTVVLFSIAKPTMGTKAVELGSGYGSGSRYLAVNFGATVDCVDLNRESNDLNRRLTEQAGLSDLVSVGEPATYFSTGLPAASFGFCFSQDALCHAGRQTSKALEEAARLLSPGGVFACTNILRAEEATNEELEEVLARLQVTSLETHKSFVGHARSAGLEPLESLDKTTSMAVHFKTLLEVAETRKTDMLKHTSPEYVDELSKDLSNWLSASNRGVLRWSFFTFRKSAARK